VIDVPVGQQDLVDAHPQLRDASEDPVDVAARVHHGGLQRRIAPQHGAVLFEGGDRNDLVSKHDFQKCAQAPGESPTRSGNTSFNSGH
jgi:hypothetical protein